MYEDCQVTEYAVPGIVPVLCQWEPRPVWGGDSQNDHRQVPVSEQLLFEAALPSSKKC